MLKHGVFNAVASIIRLGVNISAIPLLVRWLGLQEYGLLMLLQSVITIAMIAEGGISIAITVFLAEALNQPQDEPIAEILTISFTLLAILATGVALFTVINSSSIAHYLDPSNSYSYTIQQGLYLASIIIWLQILIQGLLSIIQAHQRYLISSTISTIQIIIQVIGWIILAYYSHSAYSLIKWYLLSTMIGFILYSFYSIKILRGRKISYKFNMQKAKKFFSYSFFSWLIFLGSLLFTQGDRIIVARVLGIQALGIYALMTNIVGQINTLAGLIVQPMLPFIAKNNNQIQNLKKFIQPMYKISSAIAIFLGIIVFLFAKEISALVDKEHLYPYGYLYLQIIAIIYATYSTNSINFYVLLGIKHIKACAYIQIGSGLITCLIIFLLARNFGIFGAFLGNIGFLVVYGFSIMTSLAIKQHIFVWIKWIAPLLLILGFMISLTYGFQPILSIRIMLFVLATGFIGYWMRLQYIQLNSLNEVHVS